MKLQRLFVLFSSIIILCFWLGSCSEHSQKLKAVSLYIGSAGVFRDALLEVSTLYQHKAPNVVTSYVFAGGSLLRQKVEKGEPFDVYLVASPRPMDILQSKGLISPETRRNFMSNQVVLITSTESPLKISSFKDLTSDRIKTVAIGTERLDIGRYSKEILANLGIFEILKRKVVWADLDVREILRAVETKQADVGITFLTEAKLSHDVKVVAIAPPNTHQSIVTTMAVLKQSKHPQEATALINFINSEKSRAIFEKYGFTIPSISSSS